MARKRRRKRGRSSGGLSRRALLATLGLGTIGAAGAYETGAFDAVSGERPFDVASASDDEALLGIDIQERTGDDGDRVTLLTLTNRFDSPLESISASIGAPSSAPVDAAGLDVPTQLSPGESAPITAPLACGSDTDASVEVSITASGPDESVELTRSVPVVCRGAGGGAGPCGSRPLPTDCTVDAVPKGGNGSTDCSVVITEDSPKKINGNVNISGALDIDSQSEIDLRINGNVTIADYLRLASTDEIDFDAQGAKTIGGPIQFDTSDEVTATIQTPIGGGLCVERSGSVTLGFRSANAAVRGPVSLTSTGEVDISGNGGGAEIDGDLTVDADGEVSIPGGDDDDGGNLDLTVNGNVDIDTESAVTIGGDGDDDDGNAEVDIDGNVDVDTEGEVTISLNGSTIDGDVIIRSQSEVDVTLSDGATITGSLTIDTSDEVGVNLGGGEIGGDLTIKNADEPEVDNCDAVQGTVSPASVCSDDDDDDD